MQSSPSVEENPPSRSNTSYTRKNAALVPNAIIYASGQHIVTSLYNTGEDVPRSMVVERASPCVSGLQAQDSRAGSASEQLEQYRVYLPLLPSCQYSMAFRGVPGPSNWG